MALWLPKGSLNPELFNGLALLWDPWILIMLQGLWVAVLLYTGRSKVTASTISFMVMQDRLFFTSYRSVGCYYKRYKTTQGYV